MNDPLQDLLRQVAASARQQIEAHHRTSRGVVIMVDWGDGEIGMWFDGDEDSLLQELMDDTENSLKGKLVTNKS